MIELFIRKYEQYKINKTKQMCLQNAVIGDMFEVELGAKIVNESNIKENIRIGHHFHLEGRLRTSPHGKIKIGNYCYISTGAFIGAAELIKIGDYVGIAHYTYILDNNNHPTDPEERKKHRIRVAPGGEGYPTLGTAWEMSDHKPVIIDDNVWIGMYCFIGKGVHIGEGAIVARQSVVTKDVPPYTVVAGNPARIVKELKPGADK